MPVDAFISGIVSAISLPIGAVIGILFRPTHKVVSAVMAFGSGALLAAISFELLDPALATGGIGALAIGFTLGSAVYVGLNGAVQNMGGFLRKRATLSSFAKARGADQTESIVDLLSTVALMRELPPTEIEALVPYVRPVTAAPGSIVVEAGAPDYSLYMVLRGELEVLGDGTNSTSTNTPLRTLGSGDSFGDVALLTGEPRQTTVRAKTEARVLRLAKEDFDRLAEASPALAVSVERLAHEHLERGAGSGEDVALAARRWRELALRSIRRSAVHPGEAEREVISERSGAAAVGIYLGLFLDGIPESFAIGALVVGGAAFNFPLIGAIFLSNLPEAMGSSVIMKQIGYSPLRILTLWGGLCLFTGLGAALGNIVFTGAPPVLLAGIFAMAAGAMLAMLAETAMPEAYEQGGWVVGICTILGFLAAYFLISLRGSRRRDRRRSDGGFGACRRVPGKVRRRQYFRDTVKLVQLPQSHPLGAARHRLARGDSRGTPPQAHLRSSASVESKRVVVAAGALGFLPPALAEQAGFRIRRTLVGGARSMASPVWCTSAVQIRSGSRTGDPGPDGVAISRIPMACPPATRGR